MKFKKMKHFTIIIYIFSILYVNSEASAQNILVQYFGGNKDSLIAEAQRLINITEPTFNNENDQTETNAASMADLGFEQVYQAQNRFFTTKDNTRIFAFKFGEGSENTIILIHGVASSAYLYNKTAGLLQEATQAEVYAIDLRGHGQSEGKSGDVNYVNQYVDDIAAVLTTIRKEKPNGKIIVAGHSMGGGIAMRYAMEKKYEQPDAFLLFAPLIGQDSPALQNENAKDSKQSEPFMKIHIERMIGLSMLNEIGNHENDNLPVLFLNVPQTVPLRNYSFRAHKSMAPDSYVSGLKAISKPLLVLMGSSDEVFSAEATRKAVLENSTGTVYIVDNASHNGIRHNAQAFSLIHNWFLQL